MLDNTNILTITYDAVQKKCKVLLECGEILGKKKKVVTEMKHFDVNQLAERDKN